MGKQDSWSVSFLHISDFHFKSSISEQFDRDLVLSKLLEVAESISDDEQWHPEMIFFTGDVAFSGNSSEYDASYAFLEKLMRKTRVAPRNLLLVPGNHDASLAQVETAHNEAFNAIGIDPKEYDVRLQKCEFREMIEISNRLFDSEVAVEALMSMFGGYRDFLLRYNIEPWEDLFCFVKGYQSLSGANIRVMGLNSAWLTKGQGQAEYGHLMLGMRPLHKALSKLDQERERHGEPHLRISLCHHPIEWLYETERNMIPRALLDCSDIILEGHQNHPQQQIRASSRNRTLILQEGPAYLGSHFPNQVQFFRAVGGETDLLVEAKSLMFDSKSSTWMVNNSEYDPRLVSNERATFVLREAQVKQAPESSITHWTEFYSACQKFEEGRAYLLIIGDTSTSSAETSMLGRINWNFVLDFDISTDEKGTFHAAKEELSRRSLYLLTLEEKPSFASSRSTYWVAARGLEDRPSTLVSGQWREWNQRYSQVLRTFLVEFAKASGQRPLTVVVLWHDQSFIRSVCEAIDGIFGDTANFVFGTSYTKQVSDVASALRAELIPINLADVCRGIRQMIAPIATTAEPYELPSISQEPVPLPPNLIPWLEEDLEIIHLAKGKSPTASTQPGRDFFRGATISWFELMMHDDVVRDRTQDVFRAVARDLDSRSTRRINLYHWSGSGGTTVARRVGWDLHWAWPVLLLKQINDRTAERLRVVYDTTQLSLLLIVETADVPEAKLEMLYSEVRARPFPVIFLQVVRHFTRRIRETEHVFFLDSTLSLDEAIRFAEAYSRNAPEKREALLKLKDDRTSLRNPFYFGLTAFEEDFISLQNYVERHLSKAPSAQKQVATYIAMAYHYAHKAIRLQVFSDFLSISPNTVVEFHHVFSEPTTELILSEDDNFCRPIHDLVGAEILVQVLSGSSPDRRIWRQNLSGWAKNFAQICFKVSRTDKAANDYLITLLRGLFVDRDQRESSRDDIYLHQRYAVLIEQIPTVEGKKEVLSFLVDLFPKEPHFLGHYGRFLMMELKDYANALTAINSAIEYTVGHDYILFHIKGMIIGRMALNKMEEYSVSDKKTDLMLEEVRILVEEAGEAFLKSRLYAPPEDEHGYVSHITLLAKTIEFGFAQSGLRSQEDFLVLPSSVWYRDLLDFAGELLEEIEASHEGESLSFHLTRCSSKLQEQYGDFDRALENWRSLLTEKEVYQPPVRRHIAQTFLARAHGHWRSLSIKDAEEICDLMEKNIREEPGKGRNIQLWFDAARRTDKYSVDAAIEKLTHWRANTNSVRAIFYLYILHATLAIDGSNVALLKAKDALEQCSQQARSLGMRTRTNSIEWLGPEQGLRRIVSSQELGEWDDEFKTGLRLSRIDGRIAEVSSPASGQIELTCGLRAFFAPGSRRFEHPYFQKDINTKVRVFVAFSFDGLRAWDVIDA